MKNKTTLLLIIPSVPGCSALHAADYHLIGGYSVEKINRWPICRHRMIEHYSLESRKDRERTVKAHHEAHKGQEPWDKLLTPDEAAIVYEYQKEIAGSRQAPRLCRGGLPAGARPVQVTTVSFGATRPLEWEEGAESRVQNRRVKLFFQASLTPAARCLWRSDPLSVPARA